MDAHFSDPVLAPDSSGAPATIDDGNATLGQLLRAARARRGLTLSEVSARANIPLSRLDAFERDDIGDMPLGMYQRAEIRAFADAVGVDPRIALAAIERPRPATVQPEVAFAAPGAGENNTTANVGATGDAQQMAMPVTRQTTTRRAPTRSRLVVALVALAALSGSWVAVRSLWTTRPASHDTPAAGAAPTQSAPREAITASPAAAPDVSAPAHSTADAAQPAVVQPTVTSGAPVAFPDLRIVSVPAGARVTVDGVGWGQTPVTIRYLPPGSKRVRVTRDGYVAQEQVVQLSSGAPTTTVRIALRRR